MPIVKKGKTIHNLRYQTLIAELAQERVRLGISQEQLAQQIGLNQSDISKIEKNEKRLDVLEFLLILQALRVRENIKLQQIIREYLGFSDE